MFRYAAIGVNSFIHRYDPTNMPNMYARINPAVKKWIKDIATDAQDSDCMGKNSE